MDERSQGIEGPTTVHVVPGHLEVQVFRHQVPYFTPVPCWTYVTRGLEAHQQKEIVLTLRRDPQGGDDPPRLPLQILENVYRLAAEGKRVDAWGYSYFLVPVSEGKTLPLYLAYLWLVPLPGIDLPASALTARLLLQEEFEVLQAFGLTRLVAAWGWRNRYYPCPPWSDFPPSAPVSARTMRHSLLNKMARVHLQGCTVTVEGEEAVMRLRPMARRILHDALAKIPAEQALALLPELDREANACFAWVPEQNATALNVPPGSDLSRKGCCFLAFVPGPQGDLSRLMEDGIALVVTEGTWARIREAMTAGRAATVPLEGQPKRLRLEPVEDPA
ncbi:MAG TPA: suppressor of fused domain protein [Thermoflexia bacterium]|nr:suppressor of fused domain protein [Thermoflexia bacterium]